MSARVMQGEMSKSFGVTGVKQGCILAFDIFKLFLAAVTLAFRHNISAADGVRIKYRLDGSLFNIRHLRAVTKVTNDTILDLKYVDNTALSSHTPDGLQRQLDAIFSAYSYAGLVVNSKKM